jgi:CRISPR-associated protein Cmr6
MENKNISWLFYKDYFHEVSFLANDNDKNLIKSKNKKILDAPLEVVSNILAKQHIQTVIQYPGLVTGVGINHEASVEGEFKLGMHFDYTYGMPVIYGSTVKGLLRSVFPEEKEKQKIRDCKIKQIRKYLGVGYENFDVYILKQQIFDGIKGKEKMTVDGKEKERIIYFSIYERDTFFDAVIIKPNKKGKILDSDSITSHTEGPLKNPNPITFLKIASGVTLEFRFDLKDSFMEDIKVSAEQKLDLFKQILLDFGIGAKTNVGYGQFLRLNNNLL